MPSNATDFIDLIKDIRGVTFDENGVPITGKWKEIKDWHTEVEADRAEVSSNTATSLSYKTDAESARDASVAAKDLSEAAKVTSIANKDYAMEWANSDDPISLLAGGNGTAISSKARALEAKSYMEITVAKEALVNPHYTAIDWIHTNNPSITNLYSINTDISNVSSISDSVSTVSSISASVSTLAINSNTTNIGLVADSIANVNTSATSISNINTIAPHIASVNTTATNIANVNLVAGSISDVNTVVSQVVPNLPEVLSAASNANTATTQATLASNWAIKTDDYVSSNLNSSKSWAIGGTGAGNPLEGNAKDWATKTGSAVPANTVEYSAKEYAIGTTVPTGSAKEWASNPYNSIVADGKYSALHYALSAESSASTATTNASTATTKALEASASAEAASDSEINALAHRNTAIDKATEAGTHASNASISAVGASSSATTASQQATLAAGHATSASNSASIAAQSEQDAGTHLSNVILYAAEANQSKVDAEAAETSASNSAATASGYLATVTTNVGISEDHKDNAELARDKANEWATQAEDVLVSDGVNLAGYSAYHWARKAQAVVGGVANFLDLGDVPSSYSGNANRYLKISNEETGITFDVLTKEDVGLNVVDNTTDLAKPISVATQAALDTKTNNTTTTALTSRVTTLEDDLSGIAIQAASGSYPLRTQVEQPIYLTDTIVQNISTLSDQAFATFLAVKNALAAETIGAY